MSKDKIQLLSPLFLKYQADFEKNPRSRVFAPLAETYRKLGMTDKAMEILSQGIRFHPTYVMGYLGLSFCYFDLRQFTLAYSTLRPLVETSRDNIRLQKLFADICIELGYKEEALDTYKYLLFINPRDKEVALHVFTLERSIEEQYKPVHQPIFIPESEFKSDNRIENRTEITNKNLFDIDKLENRPNSSTTDFDDWMALDLSRNHKATKSEDPYQFWNLKKGDGLLDLTDKNTVLNLEEKDSLQDESKASSQLGGFQPYVEIDFSNDEENENEIEITESVVQNTPLVTHTLVDLYCGQGHIEKALEVLEKILILNPNDEKTIKKIIEINLLLGNEQNQYVELDLADSGKQESEHRLHTKPQLEILQDISEEDGRKNLMNIFDQQIKHVEVELFSDKKPAPKITTTSGHLELKTSTQAKSDKNLIVEKRLSQFLKKIQKRALDYQARS
jgi:tetratricopeptide (TPR) repeat protein